MHKVTIDNGTMGRGRISWSGGRLLPSRRRRASWRLASPRAVLRFAGGYKLRRGAAARGQCCMNKSQTKNHAARMMALIGDVAFFNLSHQRAER